MLVCESSCCAHLGLNQTVSFHYIVHAPYVRARHKGVNQKEGLNKSCYHNRCGGFSLGLLSYNSSSFRAKPWARVLRHCGVFKPSSAVKGMQRSLKIRERTSCPGEMPGCWSAVNEGLFSVSAVPTGKVLCFLLYFKTRSQPGSLLLSSDFFLTHIWALEMCKHMRNMRYESE